MPDVLGPADAGAINTLTTTTDVSNPTAGDTWFQDCVDQDPTTGSNLPSKFMNRMLQQFRRIIRNSGTVDTSNADDDMFGQALQSGAMNWAGTFGGSANVLTATLAPAPTLLIAGLKITGILAASNTGAATLNVNALGAVPIILADGTALLGGELVSGQRASFFFDGASFVLVFIGPALDVRYLRTAQTSSFFVNASTGSDSTGNGSSGAPWATIQHAVNSIAGNFAAPGTITVNVAAGTYGGVSIPPSFISSWAFIGSGVSSCFVVSNTTSTAPGRGFTCGYGVNASISGFKISSFYDGVDAQSGASLLVTTCTFVCPLSNTDAAISSVGGKISLNGTISFLSNGTAQAAAISATLGGSVTIGYSDAFLTQAVTLAYGTITFSAATIEASQNGTVRFNPTEVAQTGTVTGPRYSATTNGVINTLGQGATYISGSSSGSTSSGGEYA
jgi:hypothetical protein